MSKNAKRVAAFLLAAVLLASCLTACGGGIESKLPGVYDNGFHQLTIYSDGTYKEELEYGTGTWTVLDGNVLKLTGFYGDTMT